MDLSDLLNKPLDEAKGPARVPAGTWRGATISANVGEERENKHGNPYFFFEIRFRADEAVEGEGEAVEAFLASDDRSSVRYSKYVEREAHLAELFKDLERAGIPAAGRTLDELVEELSSGYPAIFVVEEDGEYRNVTRFAAA